MNYLIIIIIFSIFGYFISKYIINISNIILLTNNNTKFDTMRFENYKYPICNYQYTISYVCFSSNTNAIHLFGTSASTINKPSLDTLQYIWNKHETSRKHIKEFIMNHKVNHGSNGSKAWMMSIILGDERHG